MGHLAAHAVSHPFLVAGLVAMAVAVAVYELRLRGPGGSGVSPADAVRLMNRGAMVIDLREVEAYKAGHIVNARNVPFAELTKDRAVMKKQKNKVFILVCDTGALSSRAAGVLRQAGFENAFSLKGGLRGWRDESLPLVKSA